MYTSQVETSLNHTLVHHQGTSQGTESLVTIKDGVQLPLSFALRPAPAGRWSGFQEYIRESWRSLQCSPTEATFRASPDP